MAITMVRSDSVSLKSSAHAQMRRAQPSPTHAQLSYQHNLAGKSLQSALIATYYTALSDRCSARYGN